jgi:hypothetical protein
MRQLSLLLSILLLRPFPAWAQGDEGMRPAAAAAASAEEGEALADQSPDDLDARLTAVEGPVYVRFSSLPEDSFIPAETDMSISSGDEIRVGAAGSAELVLEGETVIHLAPNSDFVVSSLEPKRTEFFLGLGSIVAKVKKLVGGSMEFRTPTVTAAVRGTELGVSEGEEGGATHVAIFDEGKVAVRGNGAEGETVVGANQEAHVHAGRPIDKPSGLKFFQQRRERMAKARGRLQQIRKSWKGRPFAQRVQHRQNLMRRPGMQRGGLQGLSPDQRQRKYEEHHQRLKQKQEERRKARQEKIQGKRKLRDGRKAQREEQRQQQRQEHAQERQQRHGGHQGQPGWQGQHQGQGQQNGPGQRRQRPGRQRQRGN